VTAASLIQNASTGTTAINGGSITTSGVQTFGNNVTLGAGTTLDTTNASASAGADLTFTGTVNGAQALTLNTGSGAIYLNGVMGGTTNLNSLSATSTNVINIGNSISTLGTQTYSGPVTVGADATLTSIGQSLNNTYNYSASTQSVTINSNSVTIQLIGASGGLGGNDGSSGNQLGQGTGPAGSYTVTLSVTPGTVLTIAPGSGGGNGVSSASGSGGGTAGTNALGVGNGGTGGNAGSSGSSGGGGGGGAASVVQVGSSGYVFAGGAGGGGGGSNYSGSPGTTAGQVYGAVPGSYSGSNVPTSGTYKGANGIQPGGDGGGSGGGGGGLIGGAAYGGNQSGEYRGIGADAGQNGYTLSSGVTVVTNTTVTNANGANGSIVITSNSASGISFSSTVNGGKALTVAASNGTVTFSGSVGNTAPLTSLTVTGKTINSASAATTKGLQSYTGPVLLGADTTLNSNSSSANGAVSFSSTLDSASTTPYALTITSGSGNETFTGVVGGTNKLAAIALTSTGTTTF
ncbi:beta strand repeat-containing protein, partial [Polynucleobacter sp. AP-RePozz3-80-G7]|uniref:beta strand repeat-containing protein n=1 Tax=Polynucleobacter sp. AP-RePozz3-80-G7 TaxID=2689105 RepID=UPI001DC9E215|nr:hypothetical protein [Polynucleobacter sp. AP-RePozz3-80-G7]